MCSSGAGTSAVCVPLVSNMSLSLGSLGSPRLSNLDEDVEIVYATVDDNPFVRACLQGDEHGFHQALRDRTDEPLNPPFIKNQRRKSSRVYDFLLGIHALCSENVFSEHRLFVSPDIRHLNQCSLLWAGRVSEDGFGRLI